MPFWMLHIGREENFSSLFFPLNIVKQNVRDPMSLHIMVTWYFDVYIIFWREVLFTKNHEDWRAGSWKRYLCKNVLNVISLFQNSLHMHTDTIKCVFGGDSKQLRPWIVDLLWAVPLVAFSSRRLSPFVM